MKMTARGYAPGEVEGVALVLPEPVSFWGGIVLSLARQQVPDMSGYTDPEIAMRVKKSHHAGLIVTSPDGDRIEHLLDDYTRRFYADFHASAPPPERATD